MTEQARVTQPRALEVPELSLVLLVGASGSGKSTFAGTHFLPTEVLSSDFCRGLVSDDENDQAATKPAFELLHFIASKRMEAGRLTVVDATNVRMEDRRPLLQLAREHHYLATAIVLWFSRRREFRADGGARRRRCLRRPAARWKRQSVALMPERPSRWMALLKATTRMV